ncbi:hypothetical protein [Novosphingobium sp.]|uniref:hypothetical protein n=1 Tax=Novosphingobium sp. TaxID=1874826 RepID=UPI001D1B5B9E|nr:hypothetical protein [Novosphingobium sp.]MBX9661734.1 hypothetical protein [Novosphingobium sp.]
MSRSLLFSVLGVMVLSSGIAEASSQPEADRAAYKREALIAKLERKYSRQLEACNRGQTAACAEANRISGEITLLRKER